MARRGYRFIAPVEETSRELVSGKFTAARMGNGVGVYMPSGSGSKAEPSEQLFEQKLVGPCPLWMKVGLGVLLGAGCIGISWWLFQQKSPIQMPVLTRLTFDSALNIDPALSPDGKLLAYASDRSGNLDIWLQHIGGGEPLRLTTDQADERQPSFSPDGSRIVFRSEIGEGGIYVMPVLGGKPRLIATKGRNPCFSPDGTLIAYWDNGARGLDRLILPGRTVKMYIVPSNGGAFTQVRPEFDVARFPLW